MKREKEILVGQFINLINAMDSTEIEIAKKHIIAYDSNTTGESQKMFQIFNEIALKENTDYNGIKNIISPNVAEESFNRQLRRTLYRVQESLIIDVNLKRKGLYDDLFRKRYEIRKRMMQASILHGKGLPDMANRVFDSIIKTAKKYELYDELIEALTFKQTISMFRKGKKSFIDINNEIAFFNTCRQSLNVTKNIHKSYMAELFNRGRKAEKINYLKKNIQLTQEYFEKTKSANIKSYYLLLKMELYYLKDDFEGEESAGQELLELMSKSRAVYSKGRIIYVCNSLANSMIALLKFDESYDYINKSIENYANKGVIKYINALQQQITSLFYLERYSDAEKLVEELTSIKILEKYTFYQAFSTYIIALNKFALSQFKDAYVLLSNLKEIEKDKEGWNVWIKIMRILCSIEMLRLNLIDYDVENFRKYIQRLDKLYEVRKRDKLVLKILRDLDRYNYDFKLVAEKSKLTLTQLRSTKDELKWDPKSPEMILFHDWFDAKMEKRSYKPNFDSYRKKLQEKQSKNILKEL